jgi:hypothetical protein
MGLELGMSFGNSDRIYMKRIPPGLFFTGGFK